MTNLNQQNKLKGNGFKLKNDSKSKVLVYQSRKSCYPLYLQSKKIGVCHSYQV